MQKKLLTAAVAGALAMPVAAFAQVTLFGSIDTGLRSQSKINVTGLPDTESDLAVVAGQRKTNRWGFHGSEDLGSGLKANFWFEGFYTSDDATDTLDGFNRKNLVGLSKGGMSVDLGRDYTVNFKSQGIYDPMSYLYTGITPAATRNTQGVRFSNLVTAGFRFGSGGIRVDYTTGSPGTTATNGDQPGVDTGDGFGINGDFAFGPVTLTGAYSTLATSDTESTNVMNFGGAYKMGAFTFRLGWSDTEAEAAGGGETNSPMIMAGVQYAISPTLDFRFGYYDTKFENTAGVETGTDKVFIFALDYLLSKRTIFYVNIDRRDIDGTAAASSFGNSLADGATGIGAGISHSF